jgi:hypothetical protein
MYAKKQAKAVGCPTEPSSELISCLRKLDPNLLTLTQPLLHDFFGGTPAKLPLSPYGPRIGNHQHLKTGGHLIEFHLIESLDRNFSIKRLKFDHLIE